MNARVGAVLGAIIAVCALLVVIVAFSVNIVAVPSAHAQIAGKIVITDTVRDKMFTAVCTKASSVTWSTTESLVSLGVVTEGKAYQASEWSWYNGKNREAVMDIFGPFNDGATYLVEIARLGGNPFEIRFDNSVKFSFSQVTASESYPDTGYAWFTVTAD
jgi:hypothetical protein